MNISIIGLGYFGFALLKHLDSQENKKFSLFARDRKELLINNLKINQKHTLFHKEITISKKVFFSTKLKDIIPQSDIIILAVPSTAIAETIEQLSPYIDRNVIIVNTAKALDRETGDLLSVIIKKNISSQVNYSLAHLAGGTIANDLFFQEPLGIDIASKNEETQKTLYNIFSSHRLHVSITSDIEGVELASAYKNIIAVLAGIVHGLGFSYGSETHIIARASGEIIKMIEMNGYIISHYPFSSYSQCWGNDMLMSCTGNTRNRTFGEKIGKYQDTKKAILIMEKQNMTIESLPTIESISSLVRNNKNSFPVLSALINIIILNKNPKEEILRTFK